MVEMDDPNSSQEANAVEVVLATEIVRPTDGPSSRPLSQLYDQRRDRREVPLSVDGAFRQLIIALQRELVNEDEENDEGKQTCCCGLVSKEGLADCLDDLVDDDDCGCCECCATCIWYLSFGTREEKLTAFIALLPILVIVPVYLVRAILAGINDDEDDWWLMYIFAAVFWMLLSWLWMFVIALAWATLGPLLTWCRDNFPRRGPYEPVPDLCVGVTLILFFCGTAVGLWFAARKIHSIEVEEDNGSLDQEFRAMPKVAEMAVLTLMCLSSLAAVWYIADSLRLILASRCGLHCKVDELTDDDEESSSNDSQNQPQVTQVELQAQHV